MKNKSMIDKFSKPTAVKHRHNSLCAEIPNIFYLDFFYSDENSWNLIFTILMAGGMGTYRASAFRATKN